MKKVKTPKKKPDKSVLSNTLWSWGEMLRSVPLAFISDLMIAVIAIVTTMIGIFLPSAVVREASGGFSLRLHMAIIPGQQGRNSRPVRVIIGGQFAT